MKYVLIGTILLDRIISTDGIRSESFGGLMYTINAFRAVCASNDEIIPVSRIGKDAYQKVKDYFRDDSRINLDGLRYFDGSNNCVKLVYKNKAERTEYSLNPMEPLGFNAVEPFLNADIIVVNFISGWDISFEAFREIRRCYSGPVYTDIHSLTLKRMENGERIPQKVNDIGRLIEGVDFVQSNEAELECIAASAREDAAFLCRQHSKEMRMIYNLTKGKEGSETALCENGDCETIKGEPCTAVEVVDPTGCGDAFAGGFISEYLKNADLQGAVKTANIMAACMGSFNGLPQSNLLKQKYDGIKRKQWKKF